MKKLAMAALGALMMAGTTAATTAPAEARVVVGFGIGGPDYYPDRVCDPYSRYYDPYRCDDEDDYYSDYYYDPIFFGGEWYRGPFRYRSYHGYREYYVHGGWHRNEWRGGSRGHVSYHDGWHGNGGGQWNGGGNHWNGGGNHWNGGGNHWNGGGNHWNGGGGHWNGGGHNGGGHHH